MKPNERKSLTLRLEVNRNAETLYNIFIQLVVGIGRWKIVFSFSMKNKPNHLWNNLPHIIYINIISFLFNFFTQFFSKFSRFSFRFNFLFIYSFFILLGKYEFRCLFAMKETTFFSVQRNELYFTHKWSCSSNNNNEKM